MKACVTGGAGFIGSHTVDNMLAKGWDVVVLDNLSTGLRQHVDARAKLIEKDIADSDLRAVFARERFDYVVHLAAQTSVPFSIDHPDIDSKENLLGLVNVLEACRHTGVKRVVFSSSAAVYGPTDSLPVPESAILQPSSFYGLTKLTGEKYLELYHQLHGLDYVVFRYANVYGERQGDSGEGGVVSIFTRNIHQGQSIHIFGDGGQTRDFIYVGDVAEANCQALVAPKAALNQVYNIGTQTQTSINCLYDILVAAAGKQVDRNYAPARAGDIYHSMLKNEAAVSQLCWQPTTILAEGLQRTYHALTE